MSEPVITATAPGRVNLLGEHTDYNEGFVLPIAIAQATRVTMRRNGTRAFSVVSPSQSWQAAFTPGEPPAEQFARYVYGCVTLAAALAGDVPGLDITIDSQVPMGVGLSSSAALEVAALRCLRELLGLAIDDVAIARLAQRAEIEHAGVRCGIMDQMASSLASTHCALLIDTRSLERRDVPLPPGTAVMVIDSGVPRALAASGYNRRREECETAARLLGLASLREMAGATALGPLPAALRRRARHVLRENARVLAAEGASAARFGALMNESHTSLRDDYEVSTPELDLLARLLQAAPGVHGAKLTGAGFGGACVALCDAGTVRTAAAQVLRQYSAAGHQGRQLVPAP